MNASVAQRVARRPAIATRETPATRWLVAVVLPFVLGRAAIVLLALHARNVRGLGGIASFAVWDGAWYAEIARVGYGFALGNGETAYPFFPLLPAVMRAGTFLGLSPVATALLLNHLVFLLALAGLFLLVRAHGSDQEATLACWSLALYPGSAPLTLVYPCTILLACGVWGFLLLERGRDGAVAALAATAALVRPNGLVLPIALGVAALGKGGLTRAVRVVLPAAAGVALWLAWLWWRTGDPLMFATAKAAWHEVTIGALLAGRERLPKIDLAALAFAFGVLALAWRRLSADWLLYAALALLPSLFLGLLGMPRYTAACFPLFVAAGIVLARLPRPLRVAALACSAAGLVFLAQRILLTRHMP